MKRLHHLVWRDCGSPPASKARKPSGERCFLCGELCDGPAGVLADLGPGFTDQNMALAPLSRSLCTPCLWAIEGKPPATLRLWSWLYRADGVDAEPHDKAPCSGPATLACNRADMTHAARTLYDPPPSGVPWGVALADSGQIHVLPYAPTNLRRDYWAVRMERMEVRARTVDFREVLDAAHELYAAGASKLEVESGEPGTGALIRVGIPAWKRAERVLGRFRGGLVSLAVWLMKREEDGCGGWAITTLGRGDRGADDGAGDSACASGDAVRVGGDDLATPLVGPGEGSTGDGGVGCGGVAGPRVQDVPKAANQRPQRLHGQLSLWDWS